MHNSTEVKTVALASGASCVGIADLEPFKQGWKVVPPALLTPFTSAISVALRLDDATIDAIDGGPTVGYAEHYRAINTALDKVTGELAKWIIGESFRAEAIPASFVADSEELLGNISHKAVARMAGIGWQGKSLLIVSPRFGPRIRLSTVLTDMPLEADGPIENRCGTCRACAKACPASAIKDVATVDRYETRDQALHFGKCAEKTLEFKTRPGIGARICGVCVKVCPFGRKNTRTATASPRTC